MTEKTKEIIHGIASAIIEESCINEEFSNKIELLISGVTEEISHEKKEKVVLSGGRPANRRDPAVIDPIAMVVENELELVKKLNSLTDKELKDIIADYGMDTSRLAMKWKDKNRLIMLILDVSRRRAAKGDAFRDNT